ncbi:hypothetical protein EON81_19495 [bacterium]|nr:MAG: hypothetical protein EON81_19495 [bacterium]
MPEDSLPFQVGDCSINGYRALGSAEFALGPTNLVVGVNGAGKTTVLRALALLLEDIARRIGPSTVEGQKPNSFDARGKTIRLYAEIVAESAPHYLSRIWKEADGAVTERRPTTSMSGAATLAKIYWQSLDDEEEDEKTLPLLCFYPISRTVSEIPLKARKEEPGSRRDAYARAFTAERHFASFFQWFRELEDYENESGRKRDPHLKAVRKAIETAMPGYTNLRVSRRPRLRMLIDKGDEMLSIQQLSDGEQGVLTLIGDIARRAAILNPHLKDPLASPGCVLVDEIDQHLHPQWQRRVVETMRKVFPNLQFVFTSHSPIVCGSVEPDSLLVLREGHVESRSVYGWSIADILKSIFDVDERPQSVHNDLLELDKALDRGDLKAARKTLSGLLDVLPETDPEVVRANVLLPILEEAARSR